MFFNFEPTLPLFFENAPSLRQLSLSMMFEPHQKILVNLQYIAISEYLHS